MSHFSKGVPAMIYEDVSEYKSAGDEYVTNYSLVVRHEDSKWSSSSWYPEGVLTQITDQKKLMNILRKCSMKLTCNTGVSDAQKKR